MNCPKNSSTGSWLARHRRRSGIIVSLLSANFFAVACLDLFGIIYLGTISSRKREFHSLVRSELTFFDHVLCKNETEEKITSKRKSFPRTHHILCIFEQKKECKCKQTWETMTTQACSLILWQKTAISIGWLDPVNFTIFNIGISTKSACSSCKLPHKRPNKLSFSHRLSGFVTILSSAVAEIQRQRKYLIDWCGFLANVCVSVCMGTFIKLHRF